MDRIEVLTTAGCAVVCAVFAAVLVAEPDRRPLQTRFALLSAAIGAVLAALLVDDTLRWPVTTWFAYALLVQLPLVSGLFVESALKASLHLPFKLVLLAGALGLPLAGLFPGATYAPPYIAVVAGLAVVTSLLLLAFAAWHARIAPTPARRGTARALLVGAGLAAIANGIDWASTLGTNQPQVGRVLVVLILFVGNEALHAEGRFALGATIRWLTGLLLACVVTGVVVAAAAGAVVDVAGVRLALVAALVPFFAVTGFVPVRAAWLRRRRQTRDTLFARLASLPVTSRDDLVAAVVRWPEVRAVAVVDARALVGVGFERVPALLASQAAAFDRPALQALVDDAFDKLTVRAAEQALLLLHSRELDLLVACDDRGSALGVAFTVLVPGEQHKDVVQLLGALARLLPSTTTSSPTTTPSTTTSATKQAEVTA
jgi:hypothetical protein